MPTSQRNALINHTCLYRDGHQQCGLGLTLCRHRGPRVLGAAPAGLGGRRQTRGAGGSARGLAAAACRGYRRPAEPAPRARRCAAPGRRSWDSRGTWAALWWLRPLGQILPPGHSCLRPGHSDRSGQQARCRYFSLQHSRGNQEPEHSPGGLARPPLPAAVMHGVAARVPASLHAWPCLGCCPALAVALAGPPVPTCRTTLCESLL